MCLNRRKAKRTYSSSCLQQRIDAFSSRPKNFPRRSALTSVPRDLTQKHDLGEFRTDHGMNESKYRSFELFRRQIIAAEVLTFWNCTNELASLWNHRVSSIPIKSRLVGLPRVLLCSL